MKNTFFIIDKDNQYIGPTQPHKNTSSDIKLSDSQHVKQTVNVGENLSHSMIGASHTTFDISNDNNYRVTKYISAINTIINTLF